jgi:hypothetical protein
MKIIARIQSGYALFMYRREQFIPIIAREYGIKTLVGAWLGDDQKSMNEVKGS